MNVVWCILFGVIGGIIGGMGMGGGTVLIPLLTIFLNFNQLIAQGINLLAFIPMSISSLVIHTKNKLVEWKKIWLIILLGVGFSVLGSYLATLINTKILKIIFGAFLILLSVFEFIKIKKE